MSRAWSWVLQRRPRVFLLAGWIVFLLGAYPGYMSVDSTLQLYSVRSGDFTDYAPVMSFVWAALEYVAAGPLPMLLLQSGLLLFGAYGVLATLIAPRRAAVGAAILLITPPVFATFAVIWPDPLAIGAFVASIACALDARRGMRVLAGVSCVLAFSCRPELVVAALPIAIHICTGSRLRRAGIATALVVGLGGTAMLANEAFTVVDTYAQQERQLMDLVGTLRRAKPPAAEIEQRFAHLPVADRSQLVPRIREHNEALDAWPLAHGDERIVDPIDTDADAGELARAWRAIIFEHLSAYFIHRWAMTRALLGFTPKWQPIFDSHGDPQLLAPVHHRARASTWQRGMRAVVRAVGATPLMRPWFYLFALGGLLWLVRSRKLAVAILVGALLQQLAVMLVFAPAAEYRQSLWLVTATWLIAIVRSCGSSSRPRSSAPGGTPGTSTSSTPTADTKTSSLPS